MPPKLDEQDPSAISEKPNENTHIERTSTQYRHREFFLTKIDSVRHATSAVRLIDLRIVNPVTHSIDGLPNHPCEDPHLFTFKPGQWIDTYVPHLRKPGGFSFVSTPRTFLDKGIASLAIQNTENPPSKWLWQDDILGKYVMIKVGGNFTFPPSGAAPDLKRIRYLQFIAGGVGINPLISMLQDISEESVLSPETKLVLHYLIRHREEALFLETINKLKPSFGDRFVAHLWITRTESKHGEVRFLNHVVVHQQFASSPDNVGQPWQWWSPFTSSTMEHFDTKENRAESLVYICGPRGLTDKLVLLYRENDMHIENGHVQIEKWW